MVVPQGAASAGAGVLFKAGVAPADAHLAEPNAVEDGRAGARRAVPACKKEGNRTLTIRPHPTNPKWKTPQRKSAPHSSRPPSTPSPPSTKSPAWAPSRWTGCRSAGSRRPPSSSASSCCCTATGRRWWSGSRGSARCASARGRWWRRHCLRSPSGWLFFNTM
jgi:hypothetical protein